MSEQVIVRTYPRGWTQTTTNLQKHLNKGYKVVHITSLPDGITEYILEKGKMDNVLYDEDLDKINQSVIKYPLGSYQVGEIARVSALLYNEGIDVLKELEELVKHNKYYMK